MQNLDKTINSLQNTLEYLKKLKNDTVFTKILLNNDSEIIIHNDEIWKDVKLYDINYMIITVNIDKQENSFTIRQALDSSFYNKKLLFTWCDIYPDEIIPIGIFKDKNIIFTYGNECRYIVNNNSDLVYKCLLHVSDLVVTVTGDFEVVD